MVTGIEKVLVLQKSKLGGLLASVFSEDDINSFAFFKVLQENTKVTAESTVSNRSTQKNSDRFLEWPTSRIESNRNRRH